VLSFFVQIDMQKKPPKVYKDINRSENAELVRFTRTNKRRNLAGKRRTKRQKLERRQRRIRAIKIGKSDTA